MAGGSIGLEIEAARTSFRWHESELRELLVGPHGPVARDLVKRAIRVEAAAKINASHSPPSIPGEGPAVRTGRLRGSITWRLGEDFLGLHADVGSAVEYAAYVELGTQNMEARPFLRPALDAGRL
jgi:HK97 gp10 family phage protein